MTRIRSTLTLLGLALIAPTAALAQGMSGGVGGSTEIEGGTTQASQVEMNAGSTPARPRSPDPSRTSDSGDTRIGMQLRLDAINMLAFSQPDTAGLDAGGVGRRLLVPMVTPGVRLVDGKLFAGLGLGLSGITAAPAANSPPGNTVSRSGWSLDPVVTYDIVRDHLAALSLVGIFNLARLSRVETCNGNTCGEVNNASLGWGLSLGAGLRGFITEAIALGGEFGWGFLDIVPSGNADHTFVHGVFGNIFLEASVGI
jgi:hypothetical protein